MEGRIPLTRRKLPRNTNNPEFPWKVYEALIYKDTEKYSPLRVKQPVSTKVSGNAVK